MPASCAVRRPTAKTHQVSNATPSASGIAQATSATSSRTGFSPGMAKDPIDSPVQSPSPVNTRAPTPLDTRQGSRISMAWRRARPTTSTNITAATRGLPKIAEMEAADPEAPMAALAWACCWPAST